VVAPKPPRAPKKATALDSKYRDLTEEEKRADFELRMKMLLFCQAIKKAAKMARTREDFYAVEMAGEELYKMSKGIIYDSMDEFFVCDIIHISRKAKLGDETHKWCIEACTNYINCLKDRLVKQPTRTFDPK
jgi:hypothetical protein